MAITETWLNGDERDSRPIAELLSILPTHELHHIPRKNRTGGGVGVCIRKSFRVRQKDCRPWNSLEYIDLLVTAQQKTPLRLILVYRPQRTKNGQQTFPTFMNDFSTLLKQLVLEPNRLMIAGDFNIHTDNPSNREAVIFSELTDSFNLKQHVLVPTHRLGHTLDLVLSRTSDDFISNISTTKSPSHLQSPSVSMRCIEEHSHALRHVWIVLEEIV